MVMHDVPLYVFFGLLACVTWRTLAWGGCIRWKAPYSYLIGIFLLFITVYVYTVIQFYQHIYRPVDATSYPPGEEFWKVGWFFPFVFGCPLAMLCSIVLNTWDSMEHVEERYQSEYSTLKHDRALQVLVLPSIFGIMNLSSIIPILMLVAGDIDEMLINSPWARLMNLAGRGVEPEPITAEEASSFARWRGETNIYVGDLYEAWMLFQFGKLILEVIGAHFALVDDSVSDLIKEDLTSSHGAVEALSWVGLSMYIIVCCVEAFLAVFPIAGGDHAKLETIMSLLTVVGFISSSAVLYNLVVVEQAFERHLDSLNPLTKFLTVKFLVSLSFAQKCVLKFCKFVFELGPKGARDFVLGIPVIGDWLNFSLDQQTAFIGTLIVYECFLLSLLHHCVWKASERWYMTPIDEDDEGLAKKEVKADQEVEM